jgi:uncharacterized protein (TIGR03435 family)
MEGGTTVRGGRYEIYNATMLDLIKAAYGVHQNAVIGGPGWLGFDRFDIIAKPPEGSSGSPSIRSMLQALLQDRFKLSVREQTAPMPAWVLLKDTSGPKLKSPSSS